MPVTLSNHCPPTPESFKAALSEVLRIDQLTVRTCSGRMRCTAAEFNSFVEEQAKAAGIANLSFRYMLCAVIKKSYRADVTPKVAEELKVFWLRETPIDAELQEHAETALLGIKTAKGFLIKNIGKTLGSYNFAKASYFISGLREIYGIKEKHADGLVILMEKIYAKHGLTLDPALREGIFKVGGGRRQDVERGSAKSTEPLPIYESLGSQLGQCLSSILVAYTQGGCPSTALDKALLLPPLKEKYAESFPAVRQAINVPEVGLAMSAVLSRLKLQAGAPDWYVECLKALAAEQGKEVRPEVLAQAKRAALFW